MRGEHSSTIWPILPAPLLGALWLLAAGMMIGSTCEFIALSRLARIVPHFEAKVAGEDTFFRGFAVAGNCRELDELAEVAGLRPVSAFGFTDDFPDEPASWHDPRAGLATIVHLLDRARSHPEHFREPERLVEDLEHLRDRLAEAGRSGVRFCFHLRMDSAYSPLEFEIRRGKY